MSGVQSQKDDGFQYDAFISYRHVVRDRQWAEWLVEALENYRVPKALQAKGHPARLRKMFRDEDEMPASGDLNDQIKKALHDSRFLIVVCSPYTPRSKWVEREIELFKEFGRDDQVLALLTEGEPIDSFPTRLLERHRVIQKPDGSSEIVTESTEPLAADVRPRPGIKAAATKQQALMRLAACILGVSYDTLKQREAERVRRTWRVRAAAAAAVLLAVAGGGGVYWDYARPKTAYFREIVWRWGLPEGLGELDKATRRAGNASYQLIWQRGRLIEVKRINSAGLLSATEEGQPPHQEIAYRSDGRPDRITEYDENGKLVREEVHLPDARKDHLTLSFERNNAPSAQSASQSLGIAADSGAQASGQSEITRHELTFNSYGFVEQRRYQDSWGTPRNDAQSSFGEHFSYSPAGQVVRVAEIQSDGSEAVLKNGLRAVVYEYNSNFQAHKRTSLGADNLPLLTSEGWATHEYTYDLWGNLVAQVSLDASGKPIANKKGWAKMTKLYNERGNRIEEAYFDAKGNPIASARGFAKLVGTFDERGLEISRSFFGIDGKPALNKDGVAKWVNTYDEAGRRIESLYFGIDGRPLGGSDTYGAAKITQKYDARGNLTERAYFNVDGKPLTIVADGYARFVGTYNDRDQLTELSFYGADGKPARSTANDAAKVTADYDPRGNRIRTSFFGVDGQPYLGNRGYSTYLWHFDAMGNLIEADFLGTDGKPTLNKEGFAKRVAEYDNHGNLIRNSIFDTTGQPAINLSGKDAGYTYVYDDRGNRTELAYFGVDGKPVLSSAGYSKSVSKFDGRGNLIDRAFFGTDGKPIVSNGGAGIARALYSYGELNTLTAVQFFDDKGTAVTAESMVITVSDGSPGAKAGVKVGDRLKSYDGKAILANTQFTDFVTAAGYGVQHTLEVRRGQDTVTLKVPPGKLGIELRYSQVEQNQPEPATPSAVPAEPVAAGAP